MPPRPAGVSVPNPTAPGTTGSAKAETELSNVSKVAHRNLNTEYFGVLIMGGVRVEGKVESPGKEGIALEHSLSRADASGPLFHFESETMQPVLEMGVTIAIFVAVGIVR